jgi:DNA end-binding protein Ku
MPRAIWSGSISFGLVNVPVRMYSAIAETDLRFHLIHAPDSGPIGYRKICKLEDKPVPDDEIVKAFEVSKEKQVVLEDEDFEAVKIEGYKTIEIKDFVPFEEIDPIYFEHTYYLGPDKGGDQVYSLLVEAMDRSGLAAIAKYVMRDRQHLGCLRIRDRVITLEKMFFADEIRPHTELAPKTGKKVDKKELDMASELIERFSGSFEPEKYEDTYRKALLQIVRAKEKKRKPEPAVAETAAEPPVDLMEALRASVQAAGKGRGRKRAPTRRRRTAKKAA